MLLDPRDTIISFLWSAATIAILILGYALASAAHGHDIWINEKHLRSPAGVLCCGVKDCGVIEGKNITLIPGQGYRIDGPVTYGEAVTGNHEDGPTTQGEVHEIVPFNEAQPSPDGKYWRCKIYDGSRRCFFTPLGFGS